MQVELWQIAGSIVGTAVVVWGANYRTAQKLAQTTELAVSTQLQTSQDKLDESIRLWQDAQVKQERAWRLEAEVERMKDQKGCDERVEVLRMRYDDLRDKYDKLVEAYSDQRIIIHDLRNDLAIAQLKEELTTTIASPPTST